MTCISTITDQNTYYYRYYLQSFIYLFPTLRSRDITLSTKVLLVKAMVFPVVMYGCESWTIKRVERRRIDALNCCVGEDSSQPLGLQGVPTSPS